ncbi:MAG TPA: hypothetical protein VEC96_10340 [Anaerolineae bacterium]|nr:hypothetical protein [Anaerolineae bacterium]
MRPFVGSALSRHEPKGQVMRLANLFVLLIILTAACQAQPVSPLPAEAEPVQPKAQAACPDLDSRLWQLTQAAAPLEMAQQWQLRVKDDKIQVLLILADEDTNFLKNFEVELGTQSGTKIQVFVPVHQLCALANTPEVMAIRPPTSLFSQ